MLIFYDFGPRALEEAPTELKNRHQATLQFTFTSPPGLWKKFSATSRKSINILPSFLTFIPSQNLLKNQYNLIKVSTQFLSTIKPLLDFDHALTTYLHQFFPHDIIYDFVFSFFSLRGPSKLIWIFAFIFYIAYLEKDRIKFIDRFFASTLSTILAIQFILKPLFHRLRPPAFGMETMRKCPIDFSFPSGHAAVAFAAAVILAHYDKKRWYLYYFLASLIAFSRIYLGCHYLSDIVGGAIIGLTISQIILHVKPVNKKIT